MTDMCWLLQVKQICTSSYNPQTDSLGERFNQTLKKTLQHIMDKDGRNWGLLLPYVLFAVHETPQAPTSFSPFELLFGRKPRGLLDVVKEAWEEQPSPFRMIIEHKWETQKHIKKVTPSSASIYSRPKHMLKAKALTIRYPVI